MSDTPCPFCGQIHGTACDATTPANPIGQIATVAATPVVAHDAQRYDWREELDMATDYGMSLAAAARVAAYIERLEAERDALRDKLESGHWLSDDEWYAGERANADFLRQYNALLAEHEAVGEATRNGVLAIEVEAAHDNAERVIHGE